ncbi:phosphatidylserine/phosphatidylglycerophosphate/cardiolipin synthase family protein [Altererythrobacter aquiaggeris]|uniref:phospholipase D-like domain-containing protein n=1 Tax=Aestuarierythrobacter aquiaggeris TaxID=1898396 RepID=UPI00301A8F8F
MTDDKLPRAVSENPVTGWQEVAPFTAQAQGQSLQFFPAGRDRLDRLITLIADAQSTLKVCFYIFAEDNAGQQVRDALIAAAERGVDVTLVLDGFGAGAGDEFFAPLSDAGGRYCKFSPRWSQRYLIRNHQKMVIADDRIAMFGGFNVADDYFAAPDVNGWHDLGLTLEGDAVAGLVDWFDKIERWTADPKANWRAMRTMVRNWDGGTGAVRWLIGGPTRGWSSWAKCVGSDLVKGKRLDMMMAYFSPSPSLLRRIGRIAKTGEARLIMAGKSDNGATIGATRALYFYLLRKKAEIYEFQPCKLHAKLIVLDDTVYVGSANFDMRSLFLNLELVLRIEDAALAETMRAYIDRHIPASEAITHAVHRRNATLVNRVKWAVSWFLVSVVDYTVSRRLNLGL